MKNIFLTTALVTLATTLPVAAATVTSWNEFNVLVGATPADGVTGESIVYDDTGVVSNGKIVFTPPEAVSPGIQVSNEPYQDSSNPTNLVLDGCIKTSSAAACDDGFQSGKRIKQVATDTGPTDLVFNLGDLSTESTYQVFGRLINQTIGALSGFSVELGYGIGSNFVAAADGGALSLSTVFTAQPGSSTNVTTQYPFGLFGDALSSPNFVLDGFFDDQRTGFDVIQTSTSITSNGYYGNYATQFGDWASSSSLAAPLPEGVFWDFDGDPDTDNLLMAWQRADGVWELRRTVGETCGVTSSKDSTIKCAPGVTLAAPVEYATKADAEAALSAAFAALDPNTLSLTTKVTATSAIYSGGPIEDLANLNLNYAIQLGDMANVADVFNYDSSQATFTLRTTVFPATIAAIPLPAGAPLLIAGLGMLAGLKRRKIAA